MTLKRMYLPQVLAAAAISLAACGITSEIKHTVSQKEIIIGKTKLLIPTAGLSTSVVEDDRQQLIIAKTITVGLRWDGHLLSFRKLTSGCFNNIISKCEKGSIELHITEANAALPRDQTQHAEPNVKIRILEVTPDGLQLYINEDQLTTSQIYFHEAKKTDAVKGFCRLKTEFKSDLLTHINGHNAEYLIKQNSEWCRISMVHNELGLIETFYFYPDLLDGSPVIAEQIKNLIKGLAN